RSRTARAAGPPDTACARRCRSPRSAAPRRPGRPPRGRRHIAAAGRACPAGYFRADLYLVLALLNDNPGRKALTTPSRRLPVAIADPRPNTEAPTQVTGTLSR